MALPHFEKEYAMGIRNRELIKGVNAHGRSRASKTNGRWVHSKKGPQAKPAAKEAVPVKQPKWYAAEDVKTPVPSRKRNKNPTKLRASVTPGTVLILLAGKNKGKRVIFLKQLASGLLLVTGPYKINGVPMRRVNQAYVIGTSTKIDVSSVNVDSIKDDFFKAPKKVAGKQDSEEFFADDSKAKKPVSEEKKKAQKAVDDVILKAVEAVPELKSYLGSKFSLNRNDKPHCMKF